MAEAFLALITPLSAPGGGWDTFPKPLPQPPLGIWGPTDPRPTHPIYGLPGQPPAVPGARPEHPIYYPPYPSQGPGFPTHPIAGVPPGGQPPLGIWGGGNVPYPTPPIYFPDQPPLGIWGPTDPRPTPPIALPPNLPPTTGGEPDRPIEWKVAWTPQTGWIVVGIPTGPTPTPSA